MRLVSIQPLLNSGSKAMNVNGTTPKTFSYTSPDSRLIIGISCICAASGATAWNKFGSLTALANGILIQATIASVPTTIATITDNMDLTGAFPLSQFGNSATDTLGTFVGFGNSADTFSGHLSFPNPNQLLLANGDSISAKVQDDLSSITALAMYAIVVQDV